MLLLSMALLAVPAFADDCEDERQAVRDAAKALGEALANLVTAIAAGDEAAIAEAQGSRKGGRKKSYQGNRRFMGMCKFVQR